METAYILLHVSYISLHTTNCTKYVNHVTCLILIVLRNLYCLRMLVVVGHIYIVHRFVTSTNTSNKCNIANTSYNVFIKWWHRMQGTLFDNKELSKCFVSFVLLPRCASCNIRQYSKTILKIIELNILGILYLLFSSQSENAIYTCRVFHKKKKFWIGLYNKKYFKDIALDLILTVNLEDIRNRVLQCFENLFTFVFFS